MKIKEIFDDVLMGKCVIFKKLNKKRRRFNSEDKSIVEDMIYEYDSCNNEEKVFLEIDLMQKLEDNKMFSLLSIPLVFVPEVVDKFNEARQISGIVLGFTYFIFYIFTAFLVIRTMSRIKFQKTFLKIIQEMKTGKIKITTETVTREEKVIKYDF